MFAQYQYKNVIPFTHVRYDHNEKIDITYCGHSVIHPLPEDMLQLVWKNSGNGMCLTDSDGIIIAVNSSFCSIIHTSEGELVGKEFTAIYSSIVDVDQLRAQYRESLEAGHFQEKYEKGILLHDDTLIDFEMTKTELVDDAQERYVLTEYVNITERKQKEKQLRDSEHNYRSLFENAFIPMYQASAEGSFLTVNKSLLKLLGYTTMEELQSINIDTELYVEIKQREEVVELMRKNGVLEGKELLLRKKDGGIIQVALHSRAVRNDSGTITGYEGILEDITARKEAEEKF